MRLDNYILHKDQLQSRNRAQQLIKAGLVKVNGRVVCKPAFDVCEEDTIHITQEKQYVSRAAYKLLYFLEDIALRVDGVDALDIGSSTGGFTQVLLEFGAQSVTAVDVGENQLHPSLRKHPRIRLYEGCDIRSFDPQKEYELVVSDVAFISLLYILDDIDRLASKDIILLFKPQFEVGREVKRDKNGVVQDKKAIQKAMQRFEDATHVKGWKLLAKEASKLAGKKGNLEWCYHFVKC